MSIGTLTIAKDLAETRYDASLSPMGGSRLFVYGQMEKVWTCILCRVNYGIPVAFPTPFDLSCHIEKVHRWEVGAFLRRNEVA